MSHIAEVDELLKRIAELEAERDRALEKAAHLYKLSEMPYRTLAIAIEDRDRLKHAEREVREENVRLRKAIEDAPHGWRCTLLVSSYREPCDCWKAALARSPLNSDAAPEIPE